VLGRFLEIGIPTNDIQASLAFYEALGFTQALTGETWTHPYAVVTDGRLFLGLHAAAMPAPRVTFVLPELRRHVSALESAGIIVESMQLATDAFNELSFNAPPQITVHIIEARTFSPPALSDTESACGYFSEWGWPVRDFAGIGEFWEQLGFVVWGTDEAPFPRLSLTSDGINLGFYRSRALRHPVLTFEDENMADRIAALRAKGFEFSDEMPDALDDTQNGVLIAPEGTRLLLLNSTE
jgi:catechol 2,3-dioxygenase-like lactoylglutathione lyase family enzyme